MAKSIKISYKEMADKVISTFVVGADDAFLKKVEKAAKGGGIFNDIGNALTTPDKKYAFFVGAPFFFFMKSKDVCFIEKETKQAYDMKPNSDWKKFYDLVLAAIAEERAK